MIFMKQFWSENVYVNTAINCLLFLTGINFLHYGQLFLPIICLILFIDNKFVFKVNQPKTFILLCLFAVSFYAFSYQLGFYSVMGFTLPMAYYIGSNLKKKDMAAAKAVILFLAVAMAMHVILNAGYEYIVHGQRGFFYSSSHYDIWMGDKLSSTLIAIDIDLMLVCVYYLIFHEKNRGIKLFCLAVFALSMFYVVVIGRRTQSLLLAILLLASFIYEAFFLKNGDTKIRKKFLIFVTVFLLVLTGVFLVYSLNLFGLRPIMDTYRIIQKLKQGLISDERFDVFFDVISLMPRYLFGGQNISKTLQLEVHNFWLDIYDFSGIVPFVLMLIYTVHYFFTATKILRYDSISNSFKILVLNLLICLFIQYNLEPVMTGASILLILSVVIGALLEGVNHE